MCYEKKIKKFCKFQIQELKKNSVKLNQITNNKKRESEILLEKTKNDFVISLTENGSEYNSEMFAKKFKQLQFETKKIVFVIGSNYGLHEDFLSKSNEKLSLGKMTYTQDLARICLMENIYRSFCMINNMPFHK